MIYEFVGFPAYEAAVESEIGLLGVLPVDASNELGIRLGRIYKLVRKGVMDLVRVTRYDGSVSLYVPLRSIRAYQTGVNKRSPTMLSHWRLAMLDSDRLRGVGRGLRSSCSAFCPSPGASNTGTYSRMDLASLCPYTLLVTIPTIMLGYFWFSAFPIPPWMILNCSRRCS